jgi:hypothetical protein
MRVGIDRIANVLTIVVCVLALPVLVAQVRSYFVAEPAVGEPLPRFPAADKLEFGTHDKIVLALVSSDCRFCTETMPAFRRLRDTVRGATLVFASNEPESRLAQYLSEHGLGSIKWVSLRKRDLLITSTPTTIVVNKDGSVAGMWQGRLTADQEAEIVALSASR